MTIPAWLLTRLEDQGHIVQTTGLGAITRRAQTRRCPECRQVVLTGLDADLAARPCVVDPTPLTTLGEAIAQMAGRFTVTLRHGPRGWQLDHRDSFAIAGHPADQVTDADVLPQHHHGPRLTSPATRTSSYDRTTAPTTPTEAPF